MDNGKIKIYRNNGIPIVEMYHNDEIQLEDVVWTHHNILNSFEPPIQIPSDLIIDRVGSYSFSENAYQCLAKLMQDSDKVAFVIHSKPQEVITDLAANTYLSTHEVIKFYALEDAVEYFTKEAGKVV